MPQRPRTVLLLLAAATLAVLTGCQTPQAGVKSVMGGQFAIVDASVEDATEAATAVLEELGLVDVTAASTAFDGEVAGFTKDRTRIEVYTAQEDEGKTQVSVMVGAMGDAATGTEIVQKIRERLAR